MELPKRLLVAGAGFLGLELMHQARKAGWQVTGLRREPGEAPGGDFVWVEADLCDLASLERVAAACEPFDWVVHCASSGRGGAVRYREVYRDGCRHLLAAFPAARLGFTSSTSVYAQSGGEWVDEESPTEPERETSRVLVETEAQVRAAGGTVLRLAGLYGPGRSVLLRRFLADEAIIERGESRYVNQIHVEDAAAAWLTLLQAGSGEVAAQVFNAADGNPLTQREVQEFLAGHFGRALPPEGDPDPDRKRGLTSKRIGSDRLQALGWAPQFPSFRHAVRQDVV